MRLWQRVLGLIAVLAAGAVLAPAAMASATATMSLNQTAGTSAGASHNLGLNLTFADSGTDSPEDLTIQLPPGLLANAAQDNGACLTTTPSNNPPAACVVGSGTVTAQPDISIIGIGLPAPVSVPVSFYLVKPQSPGDLAGLEVYSSSLGEQLGTTGDVFIRPSGDPDGVGATIHLVLPDTLTLTLPIIGKVNAAQISITSIASTFDGLRYPTTCPSSPAPFIVSTDSYDDQGAVQTLSQGLSVTGCSALAPSYNPAFSVAARRDSADHQVTLTTNITETPSEAPSQSVGLSFPTSVVGPNLAALGNLCQSLSSGCTQVGSVTAQSPLYPTALTGRAYFTGNGSGPSLTLVFPSPFPLTLVGSINLLTNSATFTGLPDIPLTTLGVTLDGGPRGLFDTDCSTPSGTATAKLLDQNGDASRTVGAKFTVAGCPSTGSGQGSGTSGGSGSGSGGSSTVSAGPTASAGGTSVAAHELSGLAKNRPSLTFRVSASKHASKIKRLTVKLPSGLSFRGHRAAHHRIDVRGIVARGAKVSSARLSHGRLVLTLRRPVRRVTVTLGPRSLRESAALLRRARAKKLKAMRLSVTVMNAQRASHAFTVTITKRHLS